MNVLPQVKAMVSQVLAKQGANAGLTLERAQLDSLKAQVISDNLAIVSTAPDLLKALNDYFEQLSTGAQVAMNGQSIELRLPEQPKVRPQTLGFDVLEVRPEVRAVIEQMAQLPALPALYATTRSLGGEGVPTFSANRFGADLAPGVGLVYQTEELVGHLAPVQVGLTRIGGFVSLTPTPGGPGEGMRLSNDELKSLLSMLLTRRPSQAGGQPDHTSTHVNAVSALYADGNPKKLASLYEELGLAVPRWLSEAAMSPVAGNPHFGPLRITHPEALALLPALARLDHDFSKSRLLNAQKTQQLLDLPEVKRAPEALIRDLMLADSGVQFPTNGEFILPCSRLAAEVNIPLLHALTHFPVENAFPASGEDLRGQLLEIQVQAWKAAGGEVAVRDLSWPALETAQLSSTEKAVLKALASAKVTASSPGLPWSVEIQSGPLQGLKLSQSQGQLCFLGSRKEGGVSVKGPWLTLSEAARQALAAYYPETSPMKSHLEVRA